MRYTISFAIATALAALTLGPAQADVPSVVTDMPPIQSLVAQVMGDLGTPLMLLAPASSPHDFQLSPSRAAAIAGADLIVWTGPELSPWLGRVLDSADTTAPTLALLASQATRLRPFALASGADESPKADHVHVVGDEHDLDRSQLDPHAWLDPDNASIWLGLIATELAKIDPDNAASYIANAAKAQADLAALDSSLADTLAPARGKPIIVFHDAYGYFAAQYGLKLAGSVSLGDATTPGAARLASLRATITAGSATCIFPDAQFDPAPVTQLASDTGIRVGGALDPEGSTQPQGPGLYAALMTGLADTIAACVTAP